MRLTGKCKVAFEDWWMIQPCDWGDLISKFYHFDESMQYGVYEDFFDSVGIIISVSSKIGFANRQLFRIYVNNSGVRNIEGIIEYPHTRSEARIKGIEKANEIYNQAIDTSKKED